MLDLNDPRWKTFKGDYQIPYDASIPLKVLEKTDDPAGGEDSERVLAELHHQGDVNIASYMTLPHLIQLPKKRNCPKLIYLL